MRSVLPPLGRLSRNVPHGSTPPMDLVSVSGLPTNAHVDFETDGLSLSIDNSDFAFLPGLKEPSIGRLQRSTLTSPVVRSTVLMLPWLMQPMYKRCDNYHRCAN